MDTNQTNRPANDVPPQSTPEVDPVPNQAPNPVDPVASPEGAPTDVPAAGMAGAAAAPARGLSWVTIAAIVALILALVGGYLAVDRGYLSTWFGGADDAAAVALVNGEPISQADYEANLAQIAQSIAASGGDATAPELQTELRTQALQTLINSEVLLQAALASDVVVSDEQVATRIDEIATSLGGQAALDARLAELGLSANELQQDIRDELLIQSYLDANLTAPEVSTADVEALYEASGGAEVLPPLEEIYPQVEQAVQQQAEQAAILELIEELRAAATIEILDEGIAAPAPVPPAIDASGVSAPAASSTEG